MTCSILHMTETGGQGGAEQVMVSVLNGLAARGCSGIAVASREGWVANAVRNSGHVAYALSTRGSFDLRYVRDLMRVVRRHRCEVIVAHMYGAITYAAIIGIMARIPVIGVLHGHSDVSANDRYRRLRGILIRAGVRHLVFVSDPLRDALLPKIGFERKRSVVIANGVDSARFSGTDRTSLRRELGLKDDAVIVGAVGNVRAAKDYPTLLRAARLAVACDERIHFVVVGAMSEPLFTEVARLAQTLELDRRVRFLGVREDVADLLAGMDIFVSSSSTEGFSIACIEAMAAGVPVVSTRSGGPEQFIQHDKNGLLVETGDAAGIAAHVLDLAEDRDRRARLGEAGRTTAKTDYSLAATVDRYFHLIVS